MVMPPAVDVALVEYVVAFTTDHADCIICPKSYLDEQGVTAFHSRKPYPIVMSFMANSGDAAIVLGMQMFRENLDSARPV